MLNSKINPDDLKEYEVEVPFTGSLFFTILAKSKTEAKKEAKAVLSNTSHEELSPVYDVLKTDEMTIRESNN